MIPTDPTFTPEQDAFVKAHYKVDMTSRAIAEHLGIGRSSVLHRAIRLGLSASYAGPTDEQGTFIREHYCVNMTSREIGAKLGLSPSTVIYWAKKAGLNRNSQRQKSDSAALALPKAQESSPPRAVHTGPNAKTCQWIDGVPSADEKCKCGEPAVVGGQGPYCPKHYARCYRRVAA